MTCHALGMIANGHRRSESSLDMKTSLAIMLAVAAVGTATLAISNPAFARGGGPDKWCGAAVCPPKLIQSGAHRGS